MATVSLSQRYFSRYLSLAKGFFIEKKAKKRKYNEPYLEFYMLHEISRIDVTDLFKGLLPVPPAPHFVAAPLD